MVGQDITGQILVVDDDQIVADLLREILEKNGYSVDVALDGISAIKLVERHNYRAIIIDIVMPGAMGGKQLYLNLVKMGVSSSERVLFITADIVSEDTTNFLNETRRLFLYKPFPVPELIRQLHLIVTQDSQPRFRKSNLKR